jgi:hypothetical protein
VGDIGSKAFAVTARSRLVSAPDIPTVDQAGLPGFYFTAWFAFFGHAEADHRQATSSHRASARDKGMLLSDSIIAGTAGGRMKDVGVIGAGKIGATVAQLLASTGDYQVTLADRSP